WMTENKCLLTCRGVFVRGVVVIVGAGPVLQMIDISFKSRAEGVDSTVALAAPALNVQAAPATQTGGSAEPDSGWTLVQASVWRATPTALFRNSASIADDRHLVRIPRGRRRGEYGATRFGEGSRRRQAAAAARRCPEQGRHVCGCHGRSGGAHADRSDGHGQEEEGRLARHAQGHGLHRDSALRA